MKGFKITWKSKKYEAALNRELQLAVRRASLVVMKETKALLSVAGETSASRAGLNTKAAKDRYLAGAKIIREQTGKGPKAAYAGVYIERKRGKNKGIYGLSRLYWNAALAKWTTASNPPAPPHKQTGELRRSIDRQIEPGGLSAKVGPRDRLVYAKALELGNNRLQPRPYLSVAFNRNMPTIEKLIAYAVAKAAASL